MRIVLLISLQFCLTNVFSQQVELPRNEQNEIVYSEVILTNQASKKQLLSRTLAYFKSNKNIDDPKTDSTIATARCKTELYGENFAQKLILTWILRIEVKDGKYKYSISELSYKPVPTPQNPQPLEFSGDALYNEYLEFLNSGKAKSKKVKNSESIFKLTDKKIREFIEEMKLKLQEEVNSEEDW